MAEDATSTPDSQDPPAAEQRIEDLEHGQDRLTEKIDEILGLIRGRGRPSEPAAPPAPPGSGDTQSAASVAEQVQAELARKEAAATEQAERQTLHDRLAKLEEQPPAPPVRRATRLLGWGNGR